MVNWGVRLQLEDRFPFPKLSSYPGVLMTWSSHLIVFLPAVLLLWVFMLYCKRRVVREKRERRLVTAIILLGASILLTLGPGVRCIYILDFAPVVHSETDDPDHYLVLGPDLQDAEDYLHLIFPDQIPEAACNESADSASEVRYPDTTHYYYRYADFVDEDFDIFAQWVLPEDEFAAEIQRIRENLADQEIYERQWGDWICLSLTEADFEEVNYYYRHYFFAYNEQTNMVRYIYSYCQDGGGEMATPYFLELDWDN